MGKAYIQVTEREQELMRQWRKNNCTIKTIMDRTGRAKKTVLSHLDSKRVGKGSGRRKVITPAAFKKLDKAVTALQKKANARTEISVRAVKEKAGVEASDRAVLEAFHEKDIWFRPLRQKPILTDEDVAERKVFGGKYIARSKEQWLRMPEAIIDNKNFPIYRNAEGRHEAARRQIRGGYRRRGDPPKSFLVKRKPGMKFPTCGVQVTAAVVNGKIRMFEFVDGNWNGEKAAQMYKGPLLRTLRKAFPEKAAKKNAKFTVLEDNDPAGYKSGKGKAAKQECGIVPFSLPKRSPDLNPLDFALWHAINVAMKKQGSKMRKNKKESKLVYMARLRKTALALPTSVVKNAVMDMHKRVRKVVQAEGGLFKE